MSDHDHIAHGRVAHTLLGGAHLGDIKGESINDKQRG
jgi:hypothetical protein